MDRKTFVKKMNCQEIELVVNKINNHAATYEERNFPSRRINCFAQFSQAGKSHEAAGDLQYETDRQPQSGKNAQSCLNRNTLENQKNRNVCSEYGPPVLLYAVFLNVTSVLEPQIEENQIL